MTNSGGKWQIDGNGHFRQSANNSYDIGSSSNRAKSIYGGTFTATTNEAISNIIDVPGTTPTIAEFRSTTKSLWWWYKN